MPVLGKVGLVNKGVYAAGTTYSALDFVKYNGSTFVALKSVKGVTPADDGTNWQYLARGAELALQNNLLTTQANTYALDAAQGPVIKAALDSLNTELANNARMITLPAGQSATVTFSTYQTVALFFTTHNNSNYEMFMYSNGYIAKNGSDTGLTATLSSDYKTVTLNNTSGQYYYIGVLHPDTATMTISAPN